MIYLINTIEIEGRETYNRVTDAMGLDRTLLSPPLLIIGGRVFQGHETIAKNIQEAFLTTAEDIFVNYQFYNPALRKNGSQLFDDYSIKSGHVTAVYFYRIVCPDCKQISPLINELPATVKVDEKELPLDIIKINTRSGNNSDRINAFFDKYNVPDSDRQVPIIFFADSYLSGTEAIKSGLLEKIETSSSSNVMEELIH
jgi:thiol-disulfide isomerase/thioredoxin